MQPELISPRLDLNTFNCPHCGALSHAKWDNMYFVTGGVENPPQMVKAARTACCPGVMSIWVCVTQNQLTTGTMIYPPKVVAPLPHPEMPADIAADFQEARMIFDQSPRSAAALLRLCLEKLCAHLLGEKRKSIHEMIGALVEQGLPLDVQQALDATKIIGNNAIHVIELDIASNPGLAQALFGLINFIVDNRISQPARIAALYKQLPEGALNAIARRDAAKP